MENVKIKDFFEGIGGDGDIGLYVAAADADRAAVVAQAENHGYRVAHDWKGVFNLLKENGKACIACGAELPKPLYDLICQYEDRGGAVQIMDKETMQFQTVQYDSHKTRLALVITEADLAQVQKSFDILSRVGLTERG